MYIDIQDGTGTAKNPKYRVALNAATADVAQKLLTENVGSSTRPVYFDGGVPVECVDFLPLTAGPDKKLTGPLGLKKDIGYGTELPEDGFEGQVFFLDDQTPDLPLGGTTGQVLVKNSNDDKDASWTSEFTGNAASANMLNSNAGSGDKPIYFDGGVPVACDDTLNVSVKGSAAKWTTARNFIISDGTNTGSAVSVDGTKAITLTLPTTIKATLKGNADTATNASAADKLNSDAGSGDKPVYFDGGVPVECGDTLGVNITGSAPKWTTARNFTISDGTNTGTPSSVDGSNNVTIKLPTTIKATLKGNADTATNANAADKLNSSNGSSTVPVYFDEGLPVPCDSLSLNTTGSAAKWTNQVNFTISSSDGTGTGAVSKVDGSANVNIKLPATIKADLTGTASEATHAVSADRLGDLNVGSANTPVYFDNGVPVDCTSPLALDTNGNAATATKWQEDRTFVITDADGTHSGENVTVNGTEDITLTLPVEIKANLKGTADLARALTENAGSATRPVYFDGGIPTNCDDFLDVNITGNAATATVASKLSVTAAGDTNTPVYFVNGVPKACTSLDLSTSGNAGSANKLNTSAGDAETPVYFENGVPKACTQVLPLSAGENYKLTGSLGLTQDVMYGSEIPESGFDGQLFFLTEDSEDFPIYVPKGGNSGEVLIKNSDTNGDISWKELVALPRGGDAGHVLIKNSITDGDASWKELVALPKGGNAGQALVKNSTTDGDAKWVTQSVELTGDVSGTANFGTNNKCSITTTIADDSHNHSNYMPHQQGGAIDCNTQYNSSYQSVAAGTNCPSSSQYGSLLTMSYRSMTNNETPDFATQIFIPNGDDSSYPDALFYRTSTHDSWRQWQRVWKVGDSITGAVWNDYAECRESNCEDFGYVLMENGDDTLSKTTERLSHFAGVSSDTWGFSQGETQRARTPIAVAGRVLAYPYQNRNNYKPGDCVCAAPGGTVDIMTREEVINWPDRIVGTVSCVPEYEEWGGGENADRLSVKVNGRIWIKVK